MVKIRKIKITNRVKLRTCRICGCSYFFACPGGCYWIADDLCSACFKYS